MNGQNLESILKPDYSTWFGLIDKSWTDYYRVNPDLCKGAEPSIMYAKNTLNEYLTAVVRRSKPSKKVGSIPAYALVLKWALNNDRKGLFLLGDCGTGKTAITEALWSIFADGKALWYNNETQTFRYEKKIFEQTTATELLDKTELDRILQYRYVMLDDIGVEAETSVSYGQKRNPIAEVVDNMEKKNGLLIMTSNLNAQQLQDKYGQRTLDRINSLCYIIQFKGESFR